MSEQVTNFQCPACTGPLHYDGALGKLKCDYCESTFTPEEIEVLYAAEAQKAASAAKAAENEQTEESSGGFYHSGEEWNAEENHLKAYHCPSCGAELICEETTAATCCPYCGNPSVVPGQLQGALKPDVVIPFRLDKTAAVEALKKHYKGKILLPKAFSDQNHLEEVKGIYVPFWLFDGEIDADILFDATRSHTHREGDEQVTITEHYHVRRGGKVPFKQIPADASSKMPDDYMDSIEPFDYSELKPFSMAYLPGYLADKYDVSMEESAARAEERAGNTAVDLLQRDAAVAYHSCTPVSKSVQLHHGRAQYGLLPVWLLTTKWNGRDFLFAMNGQTGKLIGDLPVSKGKFWSLFAGISVPLMILMALFVLL